MLRLLKPKVHRPSSESAETGWFRLMLPLTSLLGLGLAAWMAVFAAQGFRVGLSSPALLSRIESALSEQLGTTVEIGETRLSLKLEPSLEIHGLRILDPDSREGLLFAPVSVLSFSWRELASGKFYPQRLFWDAPELEGFRILKALHPQGEAAAGNSRMAGVESPFRPFFLSSRRSRIRFFSDPKQTVTADFFLEKMPGDRWQVDALGDFPGDGGQDFAVRGVYDLNEETFALQASYADQTWLAEGLIRDPGGHAVFEGNFEVSLEDASGFMQRMAPVLPPVKGALNLETEGRIPLSRPMSFEGVALQGAVDVRKGHWKGANPVAGALELLLHLAGDPRKASDLASLIYPELLDSSDLPFENFQAGIEVIRGALFLQDVLVKHPQFMIQADGPVRFQQREVDLRGQMVFMESLSRSLTTEFPFLEPLLNEKGRMILPFVCRGLLPNSHFEFDSDYVQVRLVTAPAGSESHS